MKEKIRSDIENFIVENRRWARNRGLFNDNWEEHLSRQDKLEAYLAWNGIQGYMSEIIIALEVCGWKIL